MFIYHIGVMDSVAYIHKSKRQYGNGLIKADAFAQEHVGGKACVKIQRRLSHVFNSANKSSMLRCSASEYRAKIFSS